MPKRISGYPEITQAFAADKLLIEQASSGLTKHIQLANLLGGLMQGGGTIINPHTFTVPATGTAALLGGLQTFTGLKTFGAGAKFGSSSGILDHLEMLDFSDDLELADAATAGNTPGTPPDIVYGHLIRIATFCSVVIQFANIHTTGPTSGNTVFIRGIPYAAGANSANRATGAVTPYNIAFSGFVTAQMTPNTTVCTLQENTNGAASVGITWGDLTDGTARFYFQLSYHMDD